MFFKLTNVCLSVPYVCVSVCPTCVSVCPICVSVCPISLCVCPKYRTRANRARVFYYFKSLFWTIFYTEACWNWERGILQDLFPDVQMLSLSYSMVYWKCFESILKLFLSTLSSYKEVICTAHTQLSKEFANWVTLQHHLYCWETQYSAPYWGALH